MTPALRYFHTLLPVYQLHSYDACQVHEAADALRQKFADTSNPDVEVAACAELQKLSLVTLLPLSVSFYVSSPLYVCLFVSIRVPLSLVMSALLPLYYLCLPFYLSLGNCVSSCLRLGAGVGDSWKPRSDLL